MAVPLSICMLSDDFIPAATGVGTHLQAVSEQLARRGHRVSVVTTRRRGEPERQTWRGVDVHRVFTVRAFGFYQALPSVRRLRAIFAEVRPDLLHHHYLGVMLVRAMRVAASMRLPQVYTYHMTEDHLTQPLPMRPLRPLIRAEIVRRCNRMDAVIAVSRNMAAQLPGTGITAPVTYISNPVRFPAQAQPEPATRDADFVVMFAGRLDPEKNLPLLLDGFARFRQRFTGRAELWIAGHGGQRDRLGRLAQSMGIDADVRFLGFLAHAPLARHYAACDVFVLPSLVETQGLVAMEAMWFGKPVIVADTVVSADELVDDEVNGFIVPHDRPDALAQALHRIAQDPALRQRLGEAGKQRSLRFRPEVVVDELERLYAGLFVGRAMQR
ncbi:glycosyltransferase family 4 protein [Azohydromonas sp.]|uniref:glycosyltransferase family 4 protein n=1 Tax=Azohydromonas sp. TaxID=1872666 RepID=UPI002D1FB05E|nr:glycosyltransferase family 4 protein [Azohydromonas sp.]